MYMSLPETSPAPSKQRDHALPYVGNTHTLEINNFISGAEETAEMIKTPQNQQRLTNVAIVKLKKGGKRFEVPHYPWQVCTG